MQRRKGIQLCYPLEEKRILSWSPPFVVQPKLDGERCRALLTPSEPFPGSVLLLSSEENVFQSVPHLLEPLHNLSQLTGPIELDGELYVPGCSFEEIHSIVGRTVNLSSDYDKVQYHIFDLVNEALPQWERLRLLNRIKSLTTSPELQFVRSELVESFDEIMKAYDSFVSAGYEGIIVRHIDANYIRRRSTFMLKLKPKKEDIYKIVGYKEEISKDGILKNRLGALICIGNDLNEFSIGSGINDDLRGSLWKDRESLIGKYVRVKYQHLTPGKNIPRFPIFMEVVENGDLERNPTISILRSFK